jgi:Na+-transporting NADH:ubiquinone oxidoreductase subunit F
MANHSGDADIVQLVVRLAVPPPGAAPGTPAGTVSSWLCSLRAGDPVQIAGPFGHFTATDSDLEMVFVGGGAGMAPMRSHILEQLQVLKTSRKITFWYGARTREDLFYVDEFDALQREFANFSWTAVLSDAPDSEPASSPRGFVHEHLHDSYLATHPSPASCEYYLCGPPLMIRAVNAMLKRLAVPRAQIFFDDFGS